VMVIMIGTNGEAHFQHPQPCLRREHLRCVYCQSQVLSCI
jgi:hypothetical protein